MNRRSLFGLAAGVAAAPSAVVAGPVTEMHADDLGLSTQPRLHWDAEHGTLTETWRRDGREFIVRVTPWRHDYPEALRQLRRWHERHPA